MRIISPRLDFINPYENPDLFDRTRRNYIVTGRATVTSGSEGIVISERSPNVKVRLRWLTFFNLITGGTAIGRWTLRQDGETIADYKDILVTSNGGVFGFTLDLHGLVEPQSLLELLVLNRSSPAASWNAHAILTGLLEDRK